MLSTELYETLVSAAGPIDAASQGRRAPRRPSEHNITISLGPGGGNKTAVTPVKDLSTTGICLISRQAMSRGDTFVAQLPQKLGGLLSVLCTVAHCKKLADFVYSIGAEFTCVTSNPGDPALQPGAAERISQAILKPRA